ncbi:MAG TPA: membrane dipeptidase [Reyranella sp.]|nr:membrane dipeptidase [Reyranella sp.]
MSVDPQSVHETPIVIDAVCPLLMEPRHLELYRRGGATAVAPTVGGWENAETALRTLGLWTRQVNATEDLSLVRRADDIDTAKRDGRLGIIFHFQGTDPIEGDLDLVDAYKGIGVGMIQLTYNVRNRVGDGCEERTDAGLSRFGIDHVGLGIDYFTGQHPIAPANAAAAMYQRLVEQGRWSTKAYPPPPYHFPAGIETPEGLPNLTRRLLERGYGVADTRKIMGGNWVRVFREVWGE